MLLRGTPRLRKALLMLQYEEVRQRYQKEHQGYEEEHRGYEN